MALTLMAPTAIPAAKCIVTPRLRESSITAQYRTLSSMVYEGT